MPQIYPGRYMAQDTGDIAVLLIGMRVNKFGAVRAWWPVANAMAPMLRELYAHPEKGFLGGETCLVWRGVTMIQYWRSFEDLESFARDPHGTHFPAWTDFYRNAGANAGVVGIWHETYAVRAGGAEAIYVNMPRTGLAAATGHAPVSPDFGTARKRLAGTQYASR